MKAVFLDRNTFSSKIELTPPEGVSKWQTFDATESNAETIFERAADAEIIITNKVKIGKNELANLSQLKLIQVTATGVDNIDINACKERNITVQNITNYTEGSVTEQTWGGIFAAMRGLKPYHQAVENGDWQKDGRFSLNELPIFDVAGKTLGIIGAGSIGKNSAAIGRAFGMKVLFAERKGRSPRNENFTEFESVLKQADILILQCPLTENTFHLIDDAEIKLMKKRPLLVNMARGAVINSLSVAKAIQEGRLLGLVCDVFAQEPPPANDPLLSIAHLPRVILTPHNAWASVQAQSRLWKILCENVSKFIANYKAKM